MMQMLSRRSAVSYLLHANSGLGHRTAAAAAQASAFSHSNSPGMQSDVNNKWYSAGTSPRMQFNNTLLLHKLYDSTGVESKEPTPPLLFRDLADHAEFRTAEYNEFFKETFNEYLEPLVSAHFTRSCMNDEIQFMSILCVPTVAPSEKDETIFSETKNIRLYSKGGLISDHLGGELFPSYLNFVKGAVYSSYLPPKLSSPNLDESCIVWILRNWLVESTFFMISELNREDYEEFWDNYGQHMKLGCIEDGENHRTLAPLLRFFSSESEGGMISLNDYVGRMKLDQMDIYYIASDSVTSAMNSPFLERFREKGLEVLFFVDPIDKVAIEKLKSYEDYNFVDISEED